MFDFFADNLKKTIEVPFIPWDALKERTVFITGATGMIGRALVKTLCLADQTYDLHIHLILLVRDIKKAEFIFGEIPPKTSIHYMAGNVESRIDIPEPIDYIIHCAGQTASREFVDHAVETIYTTVYGVDHTLKLAKEKNVESFVFLSSMEVYGYPQKGQRVTESEIGQFTPLNLRNSYPISKIMGEMLCFAYAKEYGVPAKIIRLTQTIGHDAFDQDQRFCAYLQKCAAKKKDIVLKTAGETERSYIDAADAVTAILAVLVKGANGKAYNAADEKTYCSIAELAQKTAADNGIKVIFDIQDKPAAEYPDTLFMNLNTDAIRGLGWMPLDEAVLK